MTDNVMNTTALPEILFQLIQTEKVRLRESDGEIHLTPVRERPADCPLLGMFSDGKISSDRFMTEKQTEKRLEL